MPTCSMEIFSTFPAATPGQETLSCISFSSIITALAVDTIRRYFFMLGHAKIVTIKVTKTWVEYDM